MDGLDEGLSVVPDLEAALVPPGVRGPGGGDLELQAGVGGVDLGPGLVVLQSGVVRSHPTPVPVLWDLTSGQPEYFQREI